MAFECSSSDSEININAITKVDDVEAHKKINRYERMSSMYAGPDFGTLDEVINKYKQNLKQYFLLFFLLLYD